MTTTTSQATGIMWHTDSLWQSEKQDKMIPALLKFHRSELRISKDRTVPVGGNRTRSYTTLDEILSKVKPVLTDCGLVLHQYLAGGEVVTMLTHESGQFIASKVAFVPMTGNKTQVEDLLTSNATAYLPCSASMPKTMMTVQVLPGQSLCHCPTPRYRRLRNGLQVVETSIKSQASTSSLLNN
jgi:hypothetical protein